MTTTQEKALEAAAPALSQGPSKAVTMETRAIDIWSRLVSLHGLLRTLKEEHDEVLDVLTFRGQWGTRLDAAEREAEALAAEVSGLLAVITAPRGAES